jgi:hypothetical protein
LKFTLTIPHGETKERTIETTENQNLHFLQKDIHCLFTYPSY